MRRIIAAQIVRRSFETVDTGDVEGGENHRTDQRRPDQFAVERGSYGALKT
jgi:hypothetical protein